MHRYDIKVIPRKYHARFISIIFLIPFGYSNNITLTLGIISNRMAKTGKKEEKKLLLRLPLKIAKAVEKRAADNQRSLNGQIVYELTITN